MPICASLRSRTSWTRRRSKPATAAVHSNRLRIKMICLRARRDPLLNLRLQRHLPHQKSPRRPKKIRMMVKSKSSTIAKSSKASRPTPRSPHPLLPKLPRTRRRPPKTSRRENLLMSSCSHCKTSLPLPHPLPHPTPHPQTPPNTHRQNQHRNTHQSTTTPPTKTTAKASGSRPRTSHCTNPARSTSCRPREPGARARTANRSRSWWAA